MYLVCFVCICKKVRYICIYMYLKVPILYLPSRVMTLPEGESLGDRGRPTFFPSCHAGALGSRAVPAGPRPLCGRCSPHPPDPCVQNPAEQFSGWHDLLPTFTTLCILVGTPAAMQRIASTDSAGQGSALVRSPQPRIFIHYCRWDDFIASIHHAGFYCEKYDSW